MNRKEFKGVVRNPLHGERIKLVGLDRLPEELG